MQEEIWRDAKYRKTDGTLIDFAGCYQVSSKGKVKSIDRIKNISATNQYSEYQCKRIISGTLLKAKINKGGYQQVTLKNKGVIYYCLISRLVASSFSEFYGEWFKDADVHHIDENKDNNTVDNLKWLSRKENCNHGTRNIRLQKKMINRKDCSKPRLQYSLDGTFIAEYPSATEIQRQLGFKASLINKCCNKIPHYKTAYGYIWKYKEERAA